MKVFKFKDKVDGNFAFILATDFKAARIHLQKNTSIPFSLCEYKEVEEIKKPIILINNILPF